MTTLDIIVKNHPVKNTGEIQRFATLKLQEDIPETQDTQR